MYVVNGRVVDSISNIPPNQIASMYVLKNEEGLQIYGSRGRNGVVVLVTKDGNERDEDEIEDFEEMIQDKIELKGWNPKTPYLKVLKKIKNNEKAYLKYVELRKKYGTSPSFFIDVADFFQQRNDEKKALQILSNVAEIDLDNYELLKSLAYKFEEYKMHEYAVYVYEQILELRPEDIQSHRDLALAYESVGEFQKSVDLLYQIVNGELIDKDENRRFSGVEMIAFNELNRMITLYKKELVISHIDSRFIKNTPADLKVLIDWNHNDTDIDLWVIDPNGEKCYYSHKRTKIGGLMSDDMTDGFGPEQFMLKKAIKGTYQIKVNYFGSSQQKISGPAFLKITIFKNYGFKNEGKTTKLVRLTKLKETIEIGEVVFRGEGN